MSECQRMDDAISGISSMATRPLLASLIDACAQACDLTVRFESVGGVDAASRVRAGEAFDLVVLAAEAIDDLAGSGHLIAETRCAIAESLVAIAVRADTNLPDVASEASLRSAVLSAGRIGYSTGPSGVALVKLFERWGVLETLGDRLVQAPAGTPVAALLASGCVDLGFQQSSELKNEHGITVLGPMPVELKMVTTFVGAVGSGSSRQAAAHAALKFMGSRDADEIRRRHGMARSATSQSLLD